jgi:hypothetical protein
LRVGQIVSIQVLDRAAWNIGTIIRRLRLILVAAAAAILVEHGESTARPSRAQRSSLAEASRAAAEVDFDALAVAVHMTDIRHRLHIAEVCGLLVPREGLRLILLQPV